MALLRYAQAIGQWLHKDSREWDSEPEYNMMRDVIKDLKVANDLAERCIKDIQEYANLAKEGFCPQRQYTPCCI